MISGQAVQSCSCSKHSRWGLQRQVCCFSECPKSRLVCFSDTSVPSGRQTIRFSDNIRKPDVLTQTSDRFSDMLFLDAESRTDVRIFDVRILDTHCTNNSALHKRASSKIKLFISHFYFKKKLISSNCKHVLNLDGLPCLYQ